MISERIRYIYGCDYIANKMSPRHLAGEMLDKDPEYQDWNKNRGNSLRNRILDLDELIHELEKERDQCEAEISNYFTASIKRLEPIAEKELIAFQEEYIRNGIKEEFNNDQEISEETGDR